MGFITTKDGTQIYYKDWGNGQPVVFSHGWPLSADAWEDQMFFLAARGYRCIAHDRRGHGRSSQPWDGNDMDTYADDLADARRGARSEGRDSRRPLDRRRRGGALHRPPRHRARRQGGADRRGAAADAEDAPPIPAACRSRSSTASARRSSPTARSSSRISARRSTATTGRARRSRRALRDSFWLQGMLAGHQGAYDCIKAFSETDFTEDLKKFDVPTLILHGDDDQIVPIGASALRSVEAGEGRDAEGLPGRAARDVHDTEGSGQRGPAGVHRDEAGTEGREAESRRQP